MTTHTETGPGQGPDIDWHHELGASFGPEPPLREQGATIHAGRTALRRRRLATGAGALAALAVVGGLGWAGAGVATDPGPGTASGREGNGVVAHSSGPSETEQPPEPGEVTFRAATEAEVDDMRPDDLIAAVTSDQVVVVRPGWKVTRFEENPLDVAAPNWSTALELVQDDRTEWVLATYRDDGQIFLTSNPAGQTTDSFRQWVEDTVALQNGQTDHDPMIMEDGDLSVRPGVTVLEKVLAPQEAAAYGPVADTAAVKFRMPDGELLFGLVVGEQVTKVEPGVLDAPTMTAFLNHVAAGADTGEGLR